MKQILPTFPVICFVKSLRLDATRDSRNAQAKVKRNRI